MSEVKIVLANSKVITLENVSPKEISHMVREAKRSNSLINIEYEDGILSINPDMVCYIEGGNERTENENELEEVNEENVPILSALRRVWDNEKDDEIWNKEGK